MALLSEETGQQGKEEKRELEEGFSSSTLLPRTGSSPPLGLGFSSSSSSSSSFLQQQSLLGPSALTFAGSSTIMAPLIQAKKWEETLLGPMHSWPQSLMTSLALTLSSKFAIILMWGPEACCFYNDAYTLILGTKHPRALGVPCREIFPEIWDFMDPVLQQIRETREAHWSEDKKMILTRNGYDEECYFTFSYGPVPVENGEIGGFFTPVSETTKRVLAERRMHTLRLLAARTAGVRSIEEALDKAMRVFSDEQNPDVPFAICYMKSGDSVILKGIAGGLQAQLAPKRVTLSKENREPEGTGAEDKDPWCLAQVIQSGKMTEIADLPSTIMTPPEGQKAPHSAVSVPLVLSEEDGAMGVLVLGLNAEKRRDEDYQGFIDLVARQLATSIASARAFEEEKLRAEALAEIDRAKTTFFQNISHEFRTPIHLGLANIRDVLDSTGGILPPEASDKLEMAYTNSLRLLKLVNSLLEFSRIEADRQKANFIPTDLPSVTKNIASMFQSAFQDAGIGFLVDVTGFPGEEEVFVDQDMWEKIILNLVSNAFKYTLAGKVEVRLGKETAANGEQYNGNEAMYEGDWAVLTVSDTGIGISEEELPRLFERFHRVEGAHGRSIEGSGIGCPMVKELVKLLSGTIEVDSTLGKGTTFIVRIPVRKASPTAPSSQPLSSSYPPSSLLQKHMEDSSLQRQAYVEEALRWLPNTNSALSAKTGDPKGEQQSYSLTSSSSPSPKKASPRIFGASLSAEDGKGVKPVSPHSSRTRGLILLADDNADMRSYIMSALVSDGYQVILKTNGLEAHQYLEDESNILPDLIVSDIMMPHMDGIELLQRLRQGINGKTTRHMPVILLSARAGEEARLNGLQEGAEDYLVKPFSKKELLSRVEFHLSIAVTRKKLEEQVLDQTKELQESERRYRELAENVPAAIYILDPEGNITYANDCWKSLFGMKAKEKEEGEEADLNAWEPILHPDDRARNRTIFNWALATREKAENEVRLVYPDGSIAHIYARQIPTYKNGTFTGFFGVSTDITRIRTLEQENIEAIRRTEVEQRKRAEEAEENRNRLQTYVDVISHEIRNPISNILNIADLLKQRLQAVDKKLKDPAILTWHDHEEEVKTFSQLVKDMELIRAIELCANHQRLIADDVLELSRLQSTQFTLLDEPFEPRMMLKDVIKMFEVRLEEEGVQLSLCMPSEEEVSLLPRAVLGDSKRISQVLINLISNALKFMAKVTEKRLTVSLSADPVDQRTAEEANGDKGHVRMLRYTVTDTGIGMTQEEQAGLFRPFSQANIKTYKEYGGSGMGLFISRILVERLGGSIQVKSQMGQETSFTFTAACRLCATTTSSSSLSPPSSFAASKNWGIAKMARQRLSDEDLSILPGRRVLIVDDNVLNQKILDKQLKAVGMRTAVADNGLEAVQIVQKSQPYPESRLDIVLLDVEMPVLTGIEAVQEIRKWEQAFGMPSVPVIGLSGNAREEHVQEALNAGMTSYATKPYKREELLARIASLLQPPQN